MIATEPIGSIPRSQVALSALQGFAAGEIDQASLDTVLDEALRDTIARMEETGSPVVTDGEQTKPSFATYPIHGMGELAPDGVVIPFADGHTRQLPRLTGGPFRYQTYAASYLSKAKSLTTRPVKQPVIAASALSLLYPGDGIPGYSREEFLSDLVDEAAADIRRALDLGADSVQIDFTEGRLAVKLDPSKGLLKSFIDLNNQVLDRFTAEERGRIGIHTCPGGDQDSTHSLDVDYTELLPELFNVMAGRFYLQLASEADPRRALEVVKSSARPEHQVFVGVTDPIDPVVETPEVVRDRVLMAAEYVAPPRLGTCDDCGFAPFADDVSTSRDVAFAKIRARVEGTQLAAEALGV